MIVLRGYGQLARESESLVAALLLPDAPIVAWWPHGAPENACETSIGRIAHRRLTNWRIQLAAALDEVECASVIAAEVEGDPDSPSPLLMAAWLNLCLDAPVSMLAGTPGTGLRRVRLTLPNGAVQILQQSWQSTAELTQPGQPAQRIALPRRSLCDCLAEELRRLGPDQVLGEVLMQLAPAGSVCRLPVNTRAVLSAQDREAAEPISSPLPEPVTVSQGNRFGA